jgi:hypothetical protein
MCAQQSIVLTIVCAAVAYIDVRFDTAEVGREAQHSIIIIKIFRTLRTIHLWPLPAQSGSPSSFDVEVLVRYRDARRSASLSQHESIKKNWFNMSIIIFDVQVDLPRQRACD